MDNLIYLKVGTGIGSGHVIKGEIFRGATGYAGEIGHLSLDINGPRCACGLRGCLVTFAGFPALMNRVEELRKDYPNSVLAASELSVDSMGKASLAGDPLALRVVQEAAESLGVVMAGVINLMNPSMVVVGGWLAGLGNLILHPIQEIAQGRTLMHALVASKIRVSEMGAQCIAIGASTLVLKAALEDSRLIPAAAKMTEPQS